MGLKKKTKLQSESDRPDDQIPSTSGEALKKEQSESDSSGDQMASTSGTRPDSSQDERNQGGELDVHVFSFGELNAAIQYFGQEWVLGEGGFGKVYKGFLEIDGKKQTVAVKTLDTDGLQGTKEFLVEVLMFRLLHHPNMIKLKGYCAEGDQRMLVYEYMPLGSLEKHLRGKKPLDWNTRMKIAAGAAKGLEYLHNTADHPVIYRDMKSANILLDDNYKPKLSDFGLAILGPVGDKTHVSPLRIGTQGYIAPEYYETGKLTLKYDIYCFGVVLLELITGREASKDSRDESEKSVVITGPEADNKLGDESEKSVVITGPEADNKLGDESEKSVVITGREANKKLGDESEKSVVITGREASNKLGDESEKSLVEWARPLFKDQKNYLGMADQKLQGQFPKSGMEQVLAIAAMCVQEQPEKRPPIADIATALNYLASQNYVPKNEPVQGNV